MALLDIFRKKNRKSPEKKEEKFQPKFAVKASVAKEKRENVKKSPSKTSEDTGDAHRILLEPVITEKNTLRGTYAFLVHPHANKQQIKDAISRVYGMNPIKVNIVRMKGRSVRRGAIYGKQAKTKKAIVTFPKGKSIEVV